MNGATTTRAPKSKLGATTDSLRSGWGFRADWPSQAPFRVRRRRQSDAWPSSQRTTLETAL
jgi:hypothetical protein